MRILVTGTTGTCLKAVCSSIACAALDKAGFSPDLANKQSQDFIQIHDLESGLPDLKTFLDSEYPDKRHKEYAELLNNVGSKIRKAKRATHHILFTHLAFYRKGTYSSYVDWALLLREFNPTIAITVIDDIYDIRKRVLDREKYERQTYSYLSLPDALHWRSAVTLLTGLLARHIRIDPGALLPATARKASSIKNHVGKPMPHFVIAAKHPLSTFYNLLFRRSNLRIYASYPITLPRYLGPEHMANINKYRQQVHAIPDTVVFDPVSIDERILHNYTNKSSGKRKATPLFVSVDHRHRWPNPDALIPCLEGMCKGKQEYPAIEIKAVTEPQSRNVQQKSLIEHHIELRDYQLIEQSEMVIAFNPFYGGRLSGGVQAEIEYAQELGKPVLIYDPDKETRTAVNKTPGVFVKAPPPIYTSWEDVTRDVRMRVKEYRDRTLGVTATYNTWEHSCI